MNTPLRVAAAIAAILLVSSPAEAKRRHKHKAAPQVTSVFCGDRYCGGADVTTPQANQAVQDTEHYSSRGDVIGGRPAGCQFRIRGYGFNWPYCGCAVSLKVYGTVIREAKRNLLQARNWAREGVRIAKSQVQPGDVVGRGGHVAYVEGGSYPNVRLYDPNSGGGKTRVRYSDLREFAWAVRPGNRMANQTR